MDNFFNNALKIKFREFNRDMSTIIIFVGLIVLVCTFFGFICGQYYALSRVKESNIEVNSLNKLALYVDFRDTSNYLKNKEYEYAKCFVDLQASNYFDDVERCLSKQECSMHIKKDIERRANEFFTNGKKPFTYYPVKNGKRECGT